MNRDEQEMALWREAYNASMLLPGDGRNAEADAAVEAFRKRFPPQQPSAPEAVWYDEPPFPKDGIKHHCWVKGIVAPQEVYWSDRQSEWMRCEGICTSPLNNRRVCPIAKPPEPTT